MVEALVRVMHEFLLYKAKESSSLGGAEPTSVTVFYHPGSHTETVPRATEGEKRKTGASNSPQRKTEADMGNLETNHGSNPDVNEIIVKIEMKKFQNLIENRIKHKNNLLQADMKRVYPLTKKSAGVG